MKQKIGLYGGSFNPVHRGHIALASHLVARQYVDQVWMVRTPQNPLKSQSELAADGDRLAMLRLAARGRRGLHVSTVEDDMPQPNYTIFTLRRLAQQYPDVEWHLIVGADNWIIFDQWREWESIVQDFHVIVYPRPCYAVPTVDSARFPSVRVATDVPLFDYASSDIRRAIASGNTPRLMLTPAVAAYIKRHRLYGARGEGDRTKK